MAKKNIVIIEGPSGVGKDTIINELIARYPTKFARPVNACTRAMRENESQGNPYLFLTEEEFKKERATGEIFEETIRHGSYRGMKKSSFEKIFESGKIALKDCDRNGLNALKKEFGDRVISIFLVCDKSIIEQRLIGRNEPIDSMTARLKDYDECILDAIYFDYVIDNIDLESTISQILQIIDKENK